MSNHWLSVICRSAAGWRIKTGAHRCNKYQRIAADTHLFDVFGFQTWRANFTQFLVYLKSLEKSGKKINSFKTLFDDPPSPRAAPGDDCRVDGDGCFFFFTFSFSKLTITISAPSQTSAFFFCYRNVLYFL